MQVVRVALVEVHHHGVLARRVEVIRLVEDAVQRDALGGLVVHELGRPPEVLALLGVGPAEALEALEGGGGRPQVRVAPEGLAGHHQGVRVLRLHRRADPLVEHEQRRDLAGPGVESRHAGGLRALIEHRQQHGRSGINGAGFTVERLVPIAEPLGAAALPREAARRLGAGGIHLPDIEAVVDQERRVIVQPARGPIGARRRRRIVQLVRERGGDARREVHRLATSRRHREELALVRIPPGEELAGRRHARGAADPLEDEPSLAAQEVHHVGVAEARRLPGLRHRVLLGGGPHHHVAGGPGIDPDRGDLEGRQLDHLARLDVEEGRVAPATLLLGPEQLAGLQGVVLPVPDVELDDRIFGLGLLLLLELRLGLARVLGSGLGAEEDPPAVLGEARTGGRDPPTLGDALGRLVRDLGGGVIALRPVVERHARLLRPVVIAIGEERHPLLVLADGDGLIGPAT